MKKSIVAATCLVILLICVVLALGGSEETTSTESKGNTAIALKQKKKRVSKSQSSASISESSILEVINEARVEIERSPLEVAPLLVQIAASRAFDMKDREYLAAASPLGETVLSVAAQAGYQHLHIAEHRVRGKFTSLEELAQTLLDLEREDTHDLLAGYTEVGIAIDEFNGDSGEIVIVTVLAVPLSACEPVQVVLVEELAKNRGLLSQIGVNVEEVIDDAQEPLPSQSVEVEELIRLTRVLDDKVQQAIDSFKDCLRTFAKEVSRAPADDADAVVAQSVPQ